LFLDLIILILLVLAALWTVMTRSLLRAAMGLALASAILTLIMFNMDASLAAVFELSVCAGLIPVLFISVISLTQPLTFKEALEHMRARLARFWVLPLIVIILGIILVLISVKFKAPLPAAQTQASARFVLWHLRQFDLLGQIIILFGGVFGVVVLFKERKKSA
jgi:NADH-quinone oxidoreductase subunit J